MRDPTNDIIKALFDALDDQVYYDGAYVPVYTRVVSWDDLPQERYIQIVSAELDQDGPKDSHISRGTVEVSIFDFYIGKNAGGWSLINSFASSVTQRIDQKFTGYTYHTQVMGRVLSIDSPAYELDDGGVVYQKLITYEFIMQEN